MDRDLSSLKVRDLGEQGLLQRLQRFCPPEIVGDDAAVLTTEPGRSLVVTTDLLVDGVHFSAGIASTQEEICTASPEDVGWRAAAVNLSDLAAMGAVPLGLTVGLGVPGDVPVVWIERFYQGLTECLGQYKTVVVGGDICRSPVITLAITAFGQSPVEIIRRSVAQPGDAILVTGVHGASRAGLELLLHPEFGQVLSAADRAALIQAHQRPQPRLDIPPQLWQLEPQSLRVAGMDSSDGLADAILQICRASEVGARVERSQIPIPPALTTPLVSPEQALEWALYGGEDFELVLCLPAEVADQMVKLGNGAVIIGSVVAGSEVQLVDTIDHAPVQILTLSQGFQHF